MAGNPGQNGELRIQDWLNLARQRLADAAARSLAGQYDSEGLGEEPEAVDILREAGFEAQILAAHGLEKPRSWIIAHPETPLTTDHQARLDDLLDRRASGTPLPYVLGHWAFYGLDFEISPAVLIPRPETELLVERALDWLNTRPGSRTADVGTGSGCIAVSLLKHNPDVRVITVDRSWEALQIARRNAARHGVEGRAAFLQGDLLTALRGPLDLVCANLPYIPEGSLPSLQVARHEPHLALDGGPDGLNAIRALIEDAPRWLAPGGLLLLEMQYDQGEAIVAMAQTFLPGSRTTVVPDLAGLPRVIEIARAA